MGVAGQVYLTLTVAFGKYKSATAVIDLIANDWDRITPVRNVSTNDRVDWRKKIGQLPQAGIVDSHNRVWGVRAQLPLCQSGRQLWEYHYSERASQ